VREYTQEERLAKGPTLSEQSNKIVEGQEGAKTLPPDRLGTGKDSIVSSVGNMPADVKTGTSEESENRLSDIESKLSNRLTVLESKLDTFLRSARQLSVEHSQSDVRRDTTVANSDQPSVEHSQSDERRSERPPAEAIPAKSIDDVELAKQTLRTVCLDSGAPPEARAQASRTLLEATGLRDTTVANGKKSPEETLSELGLRRRRGVT
jgi:hypothetical protein